MHSDARHWAIIRPNISRISSSVPPDCMHIHTALFGVHLHVSRYYYAGRVRSVKRKGTFWRLSARESREDRLQSGSADIQSPQHLDAFVPATPNQGSRTRPQPAIDHYGAVSTFHDDNICETRFSMLCMHQLSGTHYRKLFSVVTLLQFLSLG